MPDGPRVAYVLRRFPVLSETFIQREIVALRALGIRIEVFALRREPLTGLGERARGLAAEASYVDRLPKGAVRRYLAHFARTCPQRLAGLRRRIAAAPYSEFKSARENRAIFASVVALAGWAKARRMDALHAPWAYTNAYIAMEAARLLGIPFSVHARAFEVHERDRLHLLKRKFARARFVITNTEFNRRHLERWLPADAHGKLHVIRNGVEIDALPSSSPMPSGTLRLLTVARIAPQKGLEDGLRACALLGVPFHWRIVGPVLPAFRGYYEDLLRLRNELGLEDHVTFAGAMPAERTLREYGDADVFLLPCVVEANGNRDIIPNALLEAMGCGVPVVSTRVGGIPEMVDDGEQGVLVDERAPGQLHTAIERLARDPSSRVQMGARGRQRVAARFDLAKNMARYAALFRGLCANTYLSRVRERVGERVSE
jgi:glycosyltransferase involved in cell wall biosynthesis